jgi:type I restriction enzyme S subunit
MFSYVDIGAVDTKTKTIVAASYLTADAAPSRARQNVKAGDVLVSMTRPSLNAVALVPESLDGAVASTGFCVLRAREVDPKWILTTVRSPQFIRAMAELVQGALYPAVRPADVKGYSIPVPPTSEQIRIVAKLDDLYSRIERISDALGGLPALLNKCRESILAAAFRGDLSADFHSDRGETAPAVLRNALTERPRASPPPMEPNDAESALRDVALPSLPETWRYLRVDELTLPGTSVTYGIILPGPEVPGGVPYVRQQDIEDGYVRLDGLRHTTPAIAAKHERSSIRPGDVLLCIIRHLRVAVASKELDGANITQGTVRIRPSHELVIPEYLAAYLRSPFAQAWMKRRYFGMAMPRINVSDARAIPVPIPTLPEQRAILDRLSEQMNALLTVTRDVAEAMQMRETLERTILARAVRGELVPQDPNDESASALLDRIRSERKTKAQLPPTKTRKRARS